MRRRRSGVFLRARGYDFQGIAGYFTGRGNAPKAFARCQGVPVIRIAGGALAWRMNSSPLQRRLAAVNEELDAEPIGFVRLALAGARGLRRMPGIELEAALMPVL